MADPIRLFAEFTDDQGTDWRLNIHDSDFTGVAREFNLGADGFVLRYSGNNEDRYQPIIGSEVTFTLTETEVAHETFMDLLATSAEQRFSVSIRKDPDGTDDFWWGGVLYPEQVVRPYDSRPIQNTLTAADDLGNLQSILYDNDGSAYTGAVSTLDHLLNCLNKTRATHLWGTDDFLYYVNDFKSDDYAGSNQLEDTRISHYGLYNPDSNGQNQFYSTFQVLENLAKVWNARLFQAQGKWWFLPVGAQKYSSTLTVEGTQKDGTAITQQSLNAEKAFDSTFERLRGYEYTFLPPLKTVSRVRRYNGNYPIVFDSVYTESEFGTTKSDTDIDYDTGTVFAVSGTLVYNYDGDGTSTGNDRVGRIRLQFTIKAGTKYLQRNVTYDGSQLVFFGFGDPDEWPYEYTSHVYGDVSWQSSSATYSIVSEIFDKRDGGELELPFYILTPALASDENGLDITIQIFGIDDDGANNTALVATSDADYDISVLRADIVEGTALGDTVEFTATNSDNARGAIDQGEFLFGDEEAQNADGIIRVLSGVNYISTDAWDSLNDTTAALGINRLGVKEILAGQRKATKVQRGEIFGSQIYMWQVLDDSSEYYALFEMTYTARPVYTQLEAFFLTQDASTVTTAIGDAVNTNDPIILEPIVGIAGTGDTFNRYAGNGFAQLGSRNQTSVRSIQSRDTLVSSVNDTDLHIVNSWTGANGQGFIELPLIAESHGRVIQFHSDASISAVKYVTLRPNTGDTGVTINGATTYDFDRSYDGITVLGHTDNNWYIIQKKEK
jgi:hypothetical protein|tara:strand:- start:30 stop:2369 length:2340 start_codon:yes stop_codon:yes gene_type:complete